MPCLFRLCLDFGGKEEILLNGWTDYLENEFAAMKQSAVLETVQQTERQPVQAETMAQAGTGAAKAKAQTAGSESAKERNELFADPEKEARISKVREGIRQTAAAESRFAGMLTPEEEKLMRRLSANTCKYQGIRPGSMAYRHDHISESAVRRYLR